MVRALIGEDGGPDKARKGKIRCPFHRFRSVSRRAINNRHRFLGYPPPWPSPTSAFARRRAAARQARGRERTFIGARARLIHYALKKGWDRQTR